MNITNAPGDEATGFAWVTELEKRGARGVAADDDSSFNWIAFEHFDGHGEKTYEFQYTAVGASGKPSSYITLHSPILEAF